MMLLYVEENNKMSTSVDEFNMPRGRVENEFTTKPVKMVIYFSDMLFSIKIAII